MINNTVIANKKAVDQLFKKEIFVNNVNSNTDLDSIDTIIFNSATLQPNPFIIKKKPIK